MSLAIFHRDRSMSFFASTRRLMTSQIPSAAEIAAIPTLHRRVAIGLAAWVVLSCAFIVALLVVPNEPRPIDNRAPHPAPANAGPATPVRADSIKARPIFDRSRRPPQDYAPSTVSTTPTVFRDRSMKVVGIYIDGATSKAFMTTDANQAGAWMRRGDSIGGWQILSIHPRSVDLGADSEQLTVTMDTNGVGGR